MLEKFETHVPTRIVFGAGEIKRLGEFAKAYGDTALVVTTGDDMKNFGILDKALASLEAHGVKAVVYSDVAQNPKTYNVDNGVKVYRENDCQVAIGLGGGSAMDAAKGIACVIKNGGIVRDYMTGGKRFNDDITETSPCICVTTTAGTGAEVTYFSVITNPETDEKPGFGWPCMMPCVAIVDPELMLSLPYGVTAQTGIDVFFHAMEAYLSTVATPYTDMVALEAMRLVAENIDTVLTQPQNMTARSNMAWANTLGGIAIVLAATCGLHAMGHSISGVTDIPHGRALSVAAVKFLEYTYDADYARYAQVARILGASPDLSDKEAAAQLPSIMKAFLETKKMETCLSAVGVREDQLEHIADVCCSCMSFCMSVTLRPLARQDIINILRASL